MSAAPGEVIPAFGEFDPEDGTVRLLEFCPDLDGSGALRFKDTGKSANIADFEEKGGGCMSHTGDCYDTGEYISNDCALVQMLLNDALPGTDLMTFTVFAQAGTRTFVETVIVTYFKRKKAEVV